MGLIEIADSIKSMEIRGAGLIARSAADALKQQALEYQGGDLAELRKRLDAGRKQLIASRPTAISLWNAVQATVRNTSEAKSTEELRSLVVANADLFIARSSKAVDTIGKIGSKRLKDGMTVLTHCNSKAALSVIKTAHAEGKDIKAYATESRPWRQGLLTVKDLSAAGVPATLIIDSAVRWIMKDIDVVFVGADTICSNGALINKIGTSQVALAAHEARVPFIVCAETVQVLPEDRLRRAGGDRGAGGHGDRGPPPAARGGPGPEPGLRRHPGRIHRFHRHRDGRDLALRRLRGHRQGTGTGIHF